VFCGWTELFIENKPLIMKHVFLLPFIAVSCISIHCAAQSASAATDHPEVVKNLYIDVHQLQPGKVTFEDVAKAHAKDLATEKKYGVDFIKYWVNEKEGLVYCLSSSSDSESIRKTHAEAHGLLPSHIYQVTSGTEIFSKPHTDYYLDIHELGAGKVTAEAVASAHQKDLAIEKKYGVRFLNYWVDEKAGVVMCLSQATDSAAIVNTHKEAHGLIPVSVLKVKQGQ
jgi:hypothetical protein